MLYEVITFWSQAQEPIVVIEYPNMNILYRGYSNKVILAVSDADMDKIILTGENRITSYNVCYTKLLRLKKNWKNTLNCTKFRYCFPACMQNCIQEPLFSSVITSYSIHDTKLYDCRGCRD